MQPSIGNIVLYNSLRGRLTCIISNVYDLNNPYSDISLHIFNNSLQDTQYKYIDRVSYGVGTLYCWEWPDNNLPTLVTNFFKGISNASDGSIAIYNGNTSSWTFLNTMEVDSLNPENKPGLGIDSGFF